MGARSPLKREKRVRFLRPELAVVLCACWPNIEHPPRVEVHIRHEFVPCVSTRPPGKPCRKDPSGPWSGDQPCGEETWRTFAFDCAGIDPWDCDAHAQAVWAAYDRAIVWWADTYVLPNCLKP